jgi:hypothetical protein
MKELEQDYEWVIRKLRHERKRNAAIEQALATRSDDNLRMGLAPRTICREMSTAA